MEILKRLQKYKKKMEKKTGKRYSAEQIALDIGMGITGQTIRDWLRGNYPSRTYRKILEEFLNKKEV